MRTPQEQARDTVFDGHRCSVACNPPVHEHPVLVGPASVTAREVRQLLARALPALEVLGLHQMVDAGPSMVERVWRMSPRHYAHKIAGAACELEDGQPVDLSLCTVWLVRYRARLPLT